MEQEKVNTSAIYEAFQQEIENRERWLASLNPEQLELLSTSSQPLGHIQARVISNYISPISINPSGVVTDLNPFLTPIFHNFPNKQVVWLSYPDATKKIDNLKNTANWNPNYGPQLVADDKLLQLKAFGASEVNHPHVSLSSFSDVVFEYHLPSVGNQVVELNCLLSFGLKFKAEATYDQNVSSYDAIVSGNFILEVYSYPEGVMNPNFVLEKTNDIYTNYSGLIKTQNYSTVDSANGVAKINVTTALGKRYVIMLRVKAHASIRPGKAASQIEVNIYPPQ